MATIQHNDQAHAHDRSRQSDIIGLSPRSRQRYDDARNWQAESVCVRLEAVRASCIACAKTNKTCAKNYLFI